MSGLGRGSIPLALQRPATVSTAYNARAATITKARDPFGAPPPGYVPGRGRGATGFSGGVSRDDSSADIDRGDYSDRAYDEFSGYKEALFQDAEYDDEDRQADILYESIDAQMDARRKSRREKKLKEELGKLRSEKPTITQQFADLKGQLQTVTRDEWENIPDIGDYSLRDKQKRPQRYAAVPDSVLLDARASAQMLGTDQSGSIGGLSTPMPGTMTSTGGFQTPLSGFSTPHGIRTPYNGLASSLGMGGSQTPLGLMTPLGLRTPMAGGSGPSLNEVGEARGTVLSVKLDQVMQGVQSALGKSVVGGTKSSVDPRGYLTSLEALNQIKGGADESDIKKFRQLFRSVTKTNPHLAAGWIAAARIEERAGKMTAARELIAQGCKHCPQAEEVWLEAMHFVPPKNLCLVLDRAVRAMPQSVKLWVERINKEMDPKNKRTVLELALSAIPNSVRLWTEVINAGDEESKKVYLKRATECIPQSVEMWLALADLCKYDEAKSVLNNARKKVPTSAEIWVAAAKLEERHGKDIDEQKLSVLLSRAIKNLTTQGYAHERDTWIKHATEAEASNCPLTCRAVIKATIDIGVEEANACATYLADIKKCLEQKRIETARAIVKSAVETREGEAELWEAWADLEDRNGSSESVDHVLSKACELMPTEEIFWLKYAKKKWITDNDVDSAQEILTKAYDMVETKEPILLAALKVARESGNIPLAFEIAARGRRKISSERVWMQSVQLERKWGDYARGIALCEEALTKFPKFEKLWLILIHFHDERGAPESSEEAATRACEHCPGSVAVWLTAISVQLRHGNIPKARSLLDKAKKWHKKNELLCLKAVELEKAAKNSALAALNLSVGFQECPTSGLLWYEAVWMAAPAKRKTVVYEALQKDDKNAFCCLAAARLFWEEKKVLKARSWFRRALALDESLGEVWGTFLAFELSTARELRQRDILNKCAQVDPNGSFHWNSVVKKVEHWGKSVPEKLCAYVETFFPDAMKRENTSDAVWGALHGELRKIEPVSQEEADAADTADAEALKKEQETVKKRKAEAIDDGALKIKRAATDG